jgi:hypothetical protein
VSAVEIKFTALLSSQPMAIRLCIGFTAYLIDPRGSDLASDAMNKLLFGTNFRLEKMLPLQYTPFFIKCSAHGGHVMIVNVHGRA